MPSAHESSPHRLCKWAQCVSAVAVLTAWLPSAHAVDGCKFLLCIAGPWQSISQCVPTVKEVFHDLALGHPFPTCSMSGAGNNANNTRMSEGLCPGMYRLYDESHAYVGCTYSDRIAVYIGGDLWSQVYWNRQGNTSTWWSDAALTSLAQPNAAPIDETFKNDLTAWNAVQVNACTSNGGTPALDGYGAFVQCNYPDSGNGG